MADRLPAYCGGAGCAHGSTPAGCDCGHRWVVHPDLRRVTLTELDDDTSFPIERDIPPPLSPRRPLLPPTPADPLRGKRWTRAGATAAIALIAFGVLLWCSANHAHGATALLMVGGR